MVWLKLVHLGTPTHMSDRHEPRRVLEAELQRRWRNRRKAFGLRAGLFACGFCQNGGVLLPQYGGIAAKRNPVRTVGQAAALTALSLCDSQRRARLNPIEDRRR